MRKKLPLLLLVLLFFRCTPQSDSIAEIVATTRQINIPPGKIPGDTLQVHFYAPAAWTLDFDGEVPWLDVSPKSGSKGQNTSVITVIHLNTTVSPRTDSLRIFSNERTTAVPVNQPVTDLAVFPVSVILSNQAQQNTSFTIASSGDWTIVPDNFPSWLSIQPLSAGPGTHRITVRSGEENTSYDDRNTLVRVNTAGTSQNITVTQKQRDALLLVADVLNIPAEGGLFYADIRHNINYTVTIPALFNWIAQSQDPQPTKGLVSSREYFRATAGSEDGTRHGMIIFRGIGLADTLHIYQAQTDRLIFSTRQIRVPQPGGIFTVQLRTNINYDILFEDDPHWVRILQTKTMRTDQLQLEIDPLEGEQGRTARVIVRDRNSALSDTLTVLQSPREELQLSPSEIFLEDDTEFSVSLISNVPYTVIMPSGVTWVMHSGTRVQTETELVFAASPNTLLTRRETEIIVESESREIRDTLRVIQAPYAQHPFLSSTLPGIYTAGAQPLAILRPFQDQYAVRHNNNGFTFRMQHLRNGQMFSVGPVEGDPGPEEEFSVLITAVGYEQIQQGLRQCILLRIRNNTMWFVDKNSREGFVIITDIP